MITRVRAPKGFHFEVGRSSDTACDCRDCENDRKNNRVVKLYSGEKEIGHINLVRFRKGCYETHSWLSYDYHNRGLGALLYAKAIQWCHDHDYKVRSSSSPSYEAQRVWSGKTIRKFFVLKSRANRWATTWYAYPKEV